MRRPHTGLAKILGFYFLEFDNMLLYMLKEILQLWSSSGSRSERLSLDYPDGSIVITRVLVSGKLEGQSQKKKKKVWGWKQRLEWCTLKMEGRDHKPKNASDLWKLEKAKKWIIPWKLQKECNPSDTLILHFWPPVLQEKKSVLL